MDVIRSALLSTFSIKELIALLVVALLGLAFIVYTCLEGRFGMDMDFKKRAKAGKAIILSFEQYLAIHEADPERYPLEDGYKLNSLLRDYSSIVHMNRKDYEKLIKFISDQATAEKDKKVKAACIAELERMRNSLSALIDDQEKANLEAAQQTMAITKRITQVER